MKTKQCGHDQAETIVGCRECHNAYAREWRKAHPPSLEQRKKNSCTSMARVYLQRGKIKRKPCRLCKSPNAQMHHRDYSKPLKVEWLCRDCHMIVRHNRVSPKIRAIADRVIANAKALEAART